MPRHLLLTVALLVTLTMTVVGCGGDSSTPNAPSGGNTTTSGCFALVGNKGTITATISGLPTFNGIIADGGANRVGPVPIFTIGATNVQDGTSVIISGPGVVGMSAIGPSTAGSTAASNSISVQTRSCSAGIGSWFANIAAGSGTITVTSASATGVAGSFSATVEPVQGSVGQKTLTGTFNATF